MAFSYIDLGVVTPPALLVTGTDGRVVGVRTAQGFSSTMAGPYLKAALPTALQAGQMIYVSDATGAHVTGSAAFWNGTSWIDVTTGVAVV
jgi:hypothetical protein